MNALLALLCGLSLNSAFAQFPVFEFAKSDPGKIETEVSMESMSNRNGALYFRVDYSGTDSQIDRYRTFMVTFEAGALNPANYMNSMLLLNLKVYPLTRFNEKDGQSIAMHLGTTSFQSDYSLGLNAMASVKLIGFSTQFQIPDAKNFYVGVSAQALGAYLFRSYSTEKLGPEVYNKGISAAYFDIGGELGAKFGKTAGGAPVLQVTLISGNYEMGDKISLGQIFTEFNTALAEDTRFFLRFGRRWINDPNANVNGNFTDWIRLGVSKTWN